MEFDGVGKLDMNPPTRWAEAFLQEEIQDNVQVTIFRNCCCFFLKFLLIFNFNFFFIQIWKVLKWVRFLFYDKSDITLKHLNLYFF